MKFTDIFIQRPVLAIVISLVIIVAGVQAISSLTVRQYPRSDNASVTVTTAYIGADANLVRGFITTPLERAIAGADGIDYIESSSSQGVSTITARLKINYDPIKALSEISSKVDQVRSDLPPEAEVPVLNIVSADSQFASAYLSFSSKILEQNQITDYLVRVVQPRLSAIEGVQRADILGARTFAMRIWLNPDRMAALHISPTQVRTALARNNYLSALGETKGSLIKVNLTADTDLRTVDDFKNLVVYQQDGALVRLGDIANIVLGAEDYNVEVRFSGQKAVFMGIWPLPNANSLDVIDAVDKELNAIKKTLPAGLDARLAYNATSYIDNAIHEVTKTLSETLLLVVIIIFLFLGSVRSVVIPVVAIPMSLIGAVFLMQLFGFTINLLTLLAIVLSVGLVVDDAIVVVENVERHLSKGESPIDAAILGARELVGPIIAMSITLIAVYAPIAFQGGLTGSLFREFALTLAGAVAISGVVALTLSPMMSSKMLTKGIEEHGFAAKSAHAFEKVKKVYSRWLDVVLGVRPAVYVIWIAISLLTIPLFWFSFKAKELAPTEDQSVIFGIVETSANATLDQTVHSTEAVNEAYMSTPETRFTFQATFPTGGFAGMALAPWDERERTVFQILPEVQQKLSAIPGIRMFAITPPALPGGGGMPVEFLLTATAEPSEILQVAQQLQQKAMQSGNFRFLTIDTKIDQPQVRLKIDRDKVADLGLNMQQVGADLSSILGGNYVNRFNIEGRSYKVIPQIQRTGRLNPEQLENIYITGPEGKLIPLSTIASLEEITIPRSLNRFQQLNAVKISGQPIVSLDKALSYLETETAKLAPGYIVDYTGQSRQLRTEGNRFFVTFALALILIFLVLAAQFNSFRDPFVILAGSVPLAMFGALIFTFLKMMNPNIPFFTDGWTTTLNIYSQVGLVTLVGLVSKNGILIVEFAKQRQLMGYSKLEAIRAAAQTRLRPILMTTGATIGGHFPLILVTGAGAAARNSIGLVIVGGMAIGTLFTLFVVPSIYMLIARDHQKTIAIDPVAVENGNGKALAA